MASVAVATPVEDEVLQTPREAIPLNSGSAGRVSGKSWKLPKLATRRSQLSEGLKTKSWEDRMRQTTQAAAVKKLEIELKDEKQAALVARREKIQTRRKAKEEKERLALMKAKMSQKKLDRARRKAGRTKKING